MPFLEFSSNEYKSEIENVGVSTISELRRAARSAGFAWAVNT